MEEPLLNSTEFTYIPRKPFKSFMAPYTPGCVFEYFGQIPEKAYTVSVDLSPLEKAVLDNDLQLFNKLVQGGEKVSVGLKIGEMSCVEYAAMKGYQDLLQALLIHSTCSEVLKQYFQLEDVVDRAYMISKNKSTFFGESGALAEANRYLAALYTAVVYNKPQCVQIMLSYLGRCDLNRSSFFITNGSNKELLNARDLALSLGHNDCHRLISGWQKSMEIAS